MDAIQVTLVNQETLENPFASFAYGSIKYASDGKGCCGNDSYKHGQWEANVNDYVPTQQERQVILTRASYFEKLDNAGEYPEDELTSEHVRNTLGISKEDYRAFLDRYYYVNDCIVQPTNGKGITCL